MLSIIRRSPADAQPVFEAIVQSAAHLCGAIFSVVYLYEDDRLRVAATKNFTAEATNQINERQELTQPHRSYVGGRAVLDRAIVHVPDVLQDPEYSREFALAGGWRAVLAVPLLHEGKSIGAITVGKAEPKAFSEQQIQLLQAFADQAVIAIENVRLFERVETRTRELSESLEQQTATSEVLKVISSSPGALAPVFNAMLENAVRICSAQFGMLFLAEGDVFRTVALYRVPPAYAEVRRREPVHIYPGTALTRASTVKQPVQIADVQAEAAYHSDPSRSDFLNLTGARTVVAVPMLKEDQLVGVIVIYRQEVLAFTEKQVELLSNFAAQAVIAIENARLLNELRELLERQTATSEVLGVISRSPSELQPVFQAMLQNAVRLCGAKFGNLYLREGDGFRAAAMHNAPSAYAEQRVGIVHPSPNSTMGQVAQTKQPAQITDITKLPGKATPGWSPQSHLGDTAAPSACPCCTMMS